MTQALQELFERDLNRLITEIEAYSNESDMWILAKDINNTAGNLTLHLIGNLKHFIGSVIGDSGYKRQRDLEFSQKNVAREKMVAEIKETIDVIKLSLSGMNQSDLDANFPIEVFKKPMTTHFFLIHLYGHLNYHLGQINYHRRLLTNP